MSALWFKLPDGNAYPFATDAQDRPSAFVDGKRGERAAVPYTFSSFKA